MITMAYLGEEIKKLGFGLMRLPQKSEGVIDVEQTKVMVDKFLEAGFTYFDTAWAYAGSEDAICEALVERYPREPRWLHGSTARQEMKLLYSLRHPLREQKPDILIFIFSIILESTEQNFSMITVYGTGSVSRKKPA